MLIINGVVGKQNLKPLTHNQNALNAESIKQ
jgi:hypothetical protein